MITLDMLGKPCPIPVVEARKALEEPGQDDIIVLVDNLVAVQNLQEMATSLGVPYFHVAQNEMHHTVFLHPNGQMPPTDLPMAQDTAPTGLPQGITVLIAADRLGRGSETLGKTLIKGFVFSLTQLSPLPAAVIFLNGGVQLVCEGANTLKDLRVLAEKGVAIRACGTCLNYFYLTEELAVGEITDMLHITQMLADATRIVSLP